MTNGSDFIVNGDKAEHAQFPSIVALAVNNGKNGYCTGSLIHPQVVLTAAHCTPFALGSEAVYGSSNLDDYCDGCHYTIIEALNHPNYVPGQENGHNHDDLALVLLDRSVDQPVITPLLPDLLQELALKQGGEVTFAGYGRDSMAASGQLYFGAGPIIKFYSSIGEESDFAYYNTKEMVIGKDNPAAPNICYGDSGGPTYIKYNGFELLVGVTSRIPPDKPIECGHGAVVGLPGPHEDWINMGVDNLLAGLDGHKKNEIAGEAIDENLGPLVIDPVGCNYSNHLNYSSSLTVLIPILVSLFSIRYINSRTKTNF